MIFYYGIDNNKGGMENFALNLIKGVLNKEKSLSFHIISEFENFAFKDEFLKLGCSYSILPNKKKHPIKYYKSIKHILAKSNKGDLLQINSMSYCNYFLFKAAGKSKIRTMVVGHSSNSNNFIKRLLHRINRFFFRNLGVKVGANKQVIDYFFGKHCKDFHIIPVGINYDEFLFSNDIRNELRKKLSIPQNQFVIGQVGRISFEKNQIFSANILNEFKNQNIHLFLVGNDRNSKLKEKIESLSKNIHFFGEVDNISEYYNCFDMFVFPSLHESAGFALYEALANGLHCITSDKIPLDGIRSTNLEVKSLVLTEWKDSISKFKENYNFSIDERTTKCIIPTIENEIEEYLKLYNNLTK